MPPKTGKYVHGSTIHYNRETAGVLMISVPFCMYARLQSKGDFLLKKLTVYKSVLMHKKKMLGRMANRIFDRGYLWGMELWAILILF